MNNNTLKLPDNVEISALLHSEILDTSQQNEESLSLSRNFGEFPIVTVCIADVQYEGLGRSKNVRESPAGCLVFPFTIQMDDGQVVPLLQYVVSLAVTGAVQDPCDQNVIRIKWSSDLYLNGIKVGGILCTSTYRSKKFSVSAETCLDAVLRELSGIGISLFQRLSLFILFGSGRVIIQEKNENQVGLTSSGYLLAIGKTIKCVNFILMAIDRLVCLPIINHLLEIWSLLCRQWNYPNEELHN
ncbi:holocarboxylase synthetase family protein [Salix suchowensis]|nr:holocarboxylase synthetase family protein [Salix suchowensis]